MTQGRGQHSGAPIPKIEVSSGNSAELSVTLLVGNVTIVVCMLSAETPATHLPEGTLLLNMVGARLVALEAVGELGFASLAPLA